MLDNTDPYLTAAEIHKAYRISLASFHRHVKAGRIPQGELVGLRSRRWRKSTIVAAFEAMNK